MSGAGIEELRRAYPALDTLLNDPSISDFQRKLKSRPIVRKIKADLTAELKVTQADYQRTELAIACLQSLQGWIDIEPKLERNDCSRLHHLVTAASRGEIILAKGGQQDEKMLMLFDGVHPFIVQHDWAKAFENATDYGEGDVKLPFPLTCFEFRISGKTLIVSVAQADDSVEPNLAATAFIEKNGAWLCFEEKALDIPATKFAWLQIRAICIALEAEAATHSVVRAPHKLNAKRVRDGKLPLYDFHVVSLSNRKRLSNPSTSESGHHKRLHFRRGHWRHFETHRTWIKWMLVGNPELGFIDKEYRL